jgi:hypothetical protein
MISLPCTGPIPLKRDLYRRASDPGRVESRGSGRTTEGEARKILRFVEEAVQLATKKYDEKKNKVRKIEAVNDEEGSPGIKRARVSTQLNSLWCTVFVNVLALPVPYFC